MKNQHKAASLRKNFFLPMAILAAISSVASAEPVFAQATHPNFDVDMWSFFISNLMLAGWRLLAASSRLCGQSYELGL